MITNPQEINSSFKIRDLESYFIYVFMHFFDVIYCSHSYLTSYDVNRVSEEEVSSPEENDQGDAGDVGKYLHEHTNDEEKNLKRIFIDIIW